MAKLQSVRQANDLLDIMNDKRAKWSHVIAKQYKKRKKSLSVAHERQMNRYNDALLNCANCCMFTVNDADEKREQIQDAIDDLTIRYNQLYNEFKNNKSK